MFFFWMPVNDRRVKVTPPLRPTNGRDSRSWSVSILPCLPHLKKNMQMVKQEEIQISNSHISLYIYDKYFKHLIPIFYIQVYMQYFQQVIFFPKIHLWTKDFMHLATSHVLLFLSGKKSTNLEKISTNVHKYLYPSSLNGSEPG